MITNVLQEKHLRKLPKYERLRRVLLDDISSGKLCCGGKIPSESSLIERFGVSSTTARRCLDELANQGYVHRMQGKGTFVSHLAHGCNRKTIGVLFSNMASMNHPFVSAVVSGIESNFNTQQHSVEVLPQNLIFSSSNPAKALEQLVNQRNICGLFVLSPVPSSWLVELLKNNFPIVSVGVNYKECPVHRILLDSEQMLSASIDYLTSIGHRNICLFLGRWNSKIHETNDVLAITEDLIKGLSASANPENSIQVIGYDWFDFESTKDIIVNTLSKTKPSAVIAVEDSVTRLIWDVAQGNGLQIPRNLSIIAAVTHFLNYSPFTSFTANIDNFTWRASRIMEQLLEGEKPARLIEKVPGKLTVRDSTCVFNSV